MPGVVRMRGRYGTAGGFVVRSRIGESFLLEDPAGGRRTEVQPRPAESIRDADLAHGGT